MTFYFFLVVAHVFPNSGLVYESDDTALSLLGDTARTSGLKILLREAMPNGSPAKVFLT